MSMLHVFRPNPPPPLDELARGDAGEQQRRVHEQHHQRGQTRSAFELAAVLQRRLEPLASSADGISHAAIAIAHQRPSPKSDKRRQEQSCAEARHDVSSGSTPASPRAAS